MFDTLLHFSNFSLLSRSTLNKIQDLIFFLFSFAFNSQKNRPISTWMEEKKKVSTVKLLLRPKKEKEKKENLDFIDPRNNEPTLITLPPQSSITWKGRGCLSPQSACISGGPIAREVSIVGKRDIAEAATPLSRSGTALQRAVPARPRHPSIHPHVCRGNEWSLACRKVLENRVAMGWPLGQRFIPPTNVCIYIYFNFSPSLEAFRFSFSRGRKRLKRDRWPTRAGVMDRRGFRLGTGLPEKWLGIPCLWPIARIIQTR